MQLIGTLAAWRPDLTTYRYVEEAYRIAFKSLARRYLELHDEIAGLDIVIQAIVTDLTPELIARSGVGLNSAAQLLLTAGDNPERLRSEFSFAALCGVSRQKLMNFAQDYIEIVTTNITQFLRDKPCKMLFWWKHATQDMKPFWRKICAEGDLTVVSAEWQIEYNACR